MKMNYEDKKDIDDNDNEDHVQQFSKRRQDGSLGKKAAAAEERGVEKRDHHVMT